MIKYLHYLLEDPDDQFDDLFWEDGFPLNMWMSVVKSSIKDQLPINATSIDYTLSWILNQYQGEEFLFHGGDTFTTSTFITISRDRGYGIICSSTGSSQARTANQLYSWYVQDLLAGREPWLNETTICSFPEPWVNSSQVYASGHESTPSYSSDNSTELGDYAATYSHSFFGDLNITYDGDEGLTYIYNRFNCVLLRHKSYDNMFQCTGFAPHVSTDPKVVRDYRTIEVEFIERGLKTNIMEQGEEYTFTRSAASPQLLTGLLVLLVMWLHVIV